MIQRLGISDFEGRCRSWKLQFFVLLWHSSCFHCRTYSLSAIHFIADRQRDDSMMTISYNRLKRFELDKNWRRFPQ